LYLKDPTTRLYINKGRQKEVQVSNGYINKCKSGPGIFLKIGNSNYSAIKKIQAAAAKQQTTEQNLTSRQGIKQNLVNSTVQMRQRGSCRIKVVLMTYGKFSKGVRSRDHDCEVLVGGSEIANNAELKRSQDNVRLKYRWCKVGKRETEISLTLIKSLMKNLNLEQKCQNA